MFLRKLALSTSLALCSLWAAAQTDNVFWFAAPDISHIHGNAPKNGAPIYLHVTAVLPTTVTISQPADPTFIPIVFTLNELEHRTIQLDNIMSIDRIENYPQPLSALPVNVQKKAFKITSDPGDITVYYELDNYYNRDIFPLKGKNALGTDFFVSTQNHFPNGTTQYSNTTWSGFIVAATESPTRIVVYPNDDWLYFDTNPGDSIVLTLNAGETFVFRAASAAPNRHINGVRVKSNKNIVITVYDDSMQKKHTNNTNCTGSLSFDTFGDQIIPISLIGHEYIVMKGAVTVTNAPNCPADGGERVFITSTRPGNTLIYMNGVLKGTLTGPGQIFNYQIDDTTVHLLATQPVYVNHVTGFGGELGGAVLPTIDGCTGSYNVSFTRTPNTNDAFLINVMARNDKIPGSPTRNKTRESFTIFSNGVTTVIPSTYFNYFLDSSWVVLKKTPEVVAFIASKILPGNEARISNSVARFHLGIINGGTATGCKYGYFSDYRSDYANAGIGGANAQKSKTYCSYDPIHLVANGGKAYKWFGVLNPNDTAMLSSTTVADPYFTPDPIMHANVNEFQFGVRITQECFGADTLFLRVYVMAGPVALFEAATVEGCTPFNAVFTNLSDPVRAVENYWNFDTRNNTTVKQSTLTNPFEWAFPENYTDTIQEYTVRLTVKGAFHMCPNSREKIIKVKPGIKAGFMADNTVGCPPLLAHFNDTSIGYIDTLNSYWDFSVYQQSYTPSTSYSFQNNHLNDTTYLARLIAFSRFGCVDTAEFPVHVFPHIITNFGVTNLAGCSPFATNLNPLGSVGVDTFKWSIRDNQGSKIDSSFNRTNDDSFGFYHNDSSQPNPDTLFVALSGVNDFGCADTAIPKRLIIYPEVHARFTTTDQVVCDSSNITFFNNSVGYNLIHEWNLGDGAFLVDTTENNVLHKYFNRTADTKNYLVKLVTTSDFFCSDTLVDTITVYPFVKANFAIDYSNNCSPLKVQFTNTSKGGAEFDWNFGDGNLYNTPLPETLYHNYENNSDNDTTYYIHLTATNTQGCADSIDRSVFLFPRVVADFDFNSPNQGCNPLNVDFVNNSKGQNLDYIWDFGDKTYSTSQYPPPRTYKNSTDKDTTYYVNLTVMNLAGCDSSVTKTVDVYSKVTADFSIERVDSCSPFRIRIDNFSSGGITDFIWKYTENDSVILHDFSNPVIPVYHNQTLLPLKYPVILNTRNIHNCSAAKYDTITVFPEMLAEFLTDRISGCQPLPVRITNNSNIKPGTSFFWNFGDGKYSNLVTPANHVYSNLGNAVQPRTIILEATTQYGCSDTTSVTVDIFPYIYAKFNLDKPAICADELFSIDRSGSAGAINHYYWEYDDGNDEEKSDALFNYTYSNTGTNNLTPQIKLTVTNAQGCDTSWTEAITVHPQVRAKFNTDHNEACYPLPTTFMNLSEPAIPLTYYWNFGDGSTSVSKDPVHPYKNFSRTDDKLFLVKLTATSEYGCDSTISQEIVIHPKPKADFEYPVAVDCPPFRVHFTNSSMGTSLDYNWDFSNGETSVEMNPDETFLNSGSEISQNDIKLIVTTDFNCSDTTIKPVQVYPEVKADFDASEWNGCSPMQINLNGTATNENEYYWYVNDKIISNYEDPTYRFSNESNEDKVFSVRFNAVSINGCSNDTIKQITIYPKPLAEFLPYPQAQDFNTDTDLTEVRLNNQTNNQANWNYYWDFGDGSQSSESAASFLKYYSVWGDINNENRIPVSMIATNTHHPQCADTTMHFIIIKPPLPRVDIGPDISGCMPLEVDFTGTVKYINADSYQWDFGYKDQYSTDDNPASIEYDTAGMYIVRLSVSGDGGTSWDYKTIQVYPKPIVNFNFNPKYAWLRSQTEPGEPIKFFNNTFNADLFEWTFDKSNIHSETSNERQPSHEYMEAGTYYIVLRAENEFGCWDTLTSELPVLIEGHGKLEFPNAITIVPGNAPDEYYDQGENDRRIFRPINQGVEKYKLEIYNRWGELIFESNDVNRGWNGFVKGEPVKQDVYVWRVTATFTNGQPYVAAGDVTVLVAQP